MMSTTKEKILHAACRVFSRLGFNKATTQDICDLAGVNIAAVNYHFGGKENLYWKVWETLNEQTMEKLARLDDEPDPKERLRRYIRMRVENVWDETDDACFSRLAHSEMGDHSPLHEKIIDAFMEPKRQWFGQMIEQITGSGLDAPTRRVLGFCIQSPLIHLLEMRRRRTSRKRACFEDDKEALIETLFSFALAGLHGFSDHGKVDQ
ncbi:MAG: TetR/AcrR family transcriptional regulator [Lentisphaeria bacterium]|nr:TetR/AcrR family transcriptional regulator [Lentisphaeria bacterium]